jgi:hypothetical protein
MGFLHIMNDERFNMVFSFALGLGLMCLLRPICSGSECNVSKPPNDKDFDKMVYRIGGKCYEFTHTIVSCPPSGAIEAFDGDQFARRGTPITQRD